MLHCGLIDEALQKIEYAMQLNPEYGDMYRWTKACTHFLLGRYDDVLRTIDEAQDREPFLRIQAATHAMLGNKAEAWTCRTKAMEVFPTMTIAGWMDIVALRDPRHVQHYREGLSKAGFN